MNTLDYLSALTRMSFIYGVTITKKDGIFSLHGGGRSNKTRGEGETIEAASHAAFYLATIDVPVLLPTSDRSDTELLDYIALVAERSESGLTFDYRKPEGFRMMRRFHIGNPQVSLRMAIYSDMGIR